MKKLVTILTILSIQFLYCHSFYFILKEGEKKCFFEEVPKDTLIVGTFRTEDTEETLKAKGQNTNFADSIENKNFGIQIMVIDPYHQVVLSQVFEKQSKFAFTSSTGGNHEICFQTDTSAWFNPSSYVRFFF